MPVNTSLSPSYTFTFNNLEITSNTFGMKKRINILLGFHSHEPFWEMEQHFLNEVGQKTGYTYYPVTNHFLNNFPEEKPLHDYLLELARDLDIPVWLDASNELYSQLQAYRPDGLQRLVKGFQEGYVHPVLTHAHHVHTGLATSEDHVREIDLNRQLLHEEYEIPRPAHEGLFSPEASYRENIISTYLTKNLSYVMFPNLQARNTPFNIRNHLTDLTYLPYRVEDTEGNRIMALPINTAISEKVWLALEAGGFDVTQTQVERAYDHQKAIEHYKQTIYQECEAAPDNAVLVYASDFEFMGLAKYALPLIHETWQQILNEENYEFVFHDPSSLVEEFSETDLSVISIDRVSWGPAHAPVFRFDGFYPGIDDEGSELYKDYPFIFWRTGTVFAHLIDHCVTQYAPETKEDSLSPLDMHHIHNLSHIEQLELHTLLLKRACNWGWMVPEDRGRWIYVHLFKIFNLLNQQSIGDQVLDETGHAIADPWRELLRFDLSLRIEHTRHAVEQTYWDRDSSLDEATKDHLLSYITIAHSLLESSLQTLDSHLSARTLSISGLQDISRDLSHMLDALTRIYDADTAFLSRLVEHKNGHIYFQHPQLPDFLERIDSEYL